VARQRYGKNSQAVKLSRYLIIIIPRSSYLITLVFMLITAAVLAEICSALPLSGSIYIWAAEAAGPKYSRFFGFVVAWWACMSWVTYAASNCQVCSSRTGLEKKHSGHTTVFIGDSQLYRNPNSCMGGILSRWHRRL